MNQKEFMNRLELLLAGIPEEEKQEALQFYRDYFEDAGEENASKVIQELGSPEKVADMIKADLNGESRDSGEFTEQGYTDERFEQKASPVPRPNRYKRDGGGYTYHSTQGSQTYERNAYRAEDQTVPPRTSRTLKIVLVILIALAVIPFAWPLLFSVVAIAIALVCAAFGIFAGMVIGAVVLMIVGIVIFILGLTKLLTALPIALLTSGTGLLLFVLGLIATVATIKLCIVIYPAIFRGIVNICRWPFHRKAVS